MRRPLSLAAVVVAAALLTTGGMGSGPDAAVAATGTDRLVEVEYFAEPDGPGRYTRVPTETPAARVAPPRGLTAAEATRDGDVRTVSRTGPSAARLDVVLVGDGYTLGQQDEFLADAKARWADVLGREPYRSYQGLFNVWAVEAVSADRGVSGDPTEDVVRDTALGTYFWCAGVERLLCVDLNKVARYARRAPAADLVVVVANSEKYGGAGYSGLAGSYSFAGVSTLSSDNPLSSEVAAHEIGHSVGLLADEYVYPTFGLYTGTEPEDINSTLYQSRELVRRKAKWFRWVGASDPTGGQVGTFEGSSFYPRGLYRPTADSLMRSLATPEFNLPGREAMVAGFYRYARLVTSRTGTDEAVLPTQRVTVAVAPVGRLADVHVRWYVDGREVPSARGLTSVVPARLGVPADGSPHAVRVTVTDRTRALRAPELKALATDSLSWTVAP